MNVSILQISDLHRDPSHEIDNPALIRSMQSDYLKYQTEETPIAAPDLMVVSGDIVQGVSPATIDPRSKLEEQYRQAEELLVALTDHFFSGDRDRVVLVPGNHDISLYHVHASLRPLPFGLLRRPTTIAQYVSRLFQPNSSVRWSWQDLTFHEIADIGIYHERLDAFATFYSRFYQGSKAYSLKPADQYAIFDYPVSNITIVAFNSCCNNDPLNRQGQIHPAAIAAATAELRHTRFSSRLRIAVWHHNTSGGPSDCDYLDADTLQVLIDSDFSIGLHGHQHKSQFIDERFLRHLSEDYGNQCRDVVWWTAGLASGPRPFVQHSYHRHRTILRRLASKANAQ